MLPQLTRLELGQCDAGAGMCKALVKGNRPHLAVLNLAKNRLGSADAQDLAEGHLPALASLNLHWNDIGMQTSTCFWGLCDWPCLTAMTISDYYLGVSDIEALVKCRHWPLLAHLDVSHNRLESKYLKSLAQGQWPALLELCLANNDNSAAEDLLSADWKSLGMLDLGATDHADYTPLAAVQALLQIFGGSLHTLNFSCQARVATTAAPQQQSWPRKTILRINALASGAALHSLTHGYWPATSLSLYHLGDLTSPPSAQLLQLNLTMMESLSLDGIRLGFRLSLEDGHIAFNLHNGNWPALKELHLHACNLKDEYVVQLTSGQWLLLESLDLSCNFCSVQGVQQLVTAPWPNLNFLDVRQNKFNGNSYGNDYDLDLLEHSEQRKAFVKSSEARWSSIRLLVTNEDIIDDIADWTPF